MSNGDCILPDCGLTVSSTPLPLFGLATGFPLANPGGGFGGQVGGGGFPTAFPRFQGPAPPRAPPKPIFTPKPRAPPAPVATPPAKPPAPPPPPTPVGEPPIDEPYYGSYNEDVFKQYQQTWLDRLMSKVFGEGIDYMFLGKILSGAGDVFNLLTYSADLGPSAAEEAAAVEATLATQNTGRLPYADPLANISGSLASAVALPDLTGLFDPGGDPAASLAPLTVSASRIRPTGITLTEPYLAPVSNTLLQPGLAIPQASVRPLTGTVTATAPAVVGLTMPTSRPRLGLPGQLAKPGLALVPGQVPGIAPGLAYNMSPAEGTQPGEAPSSKDCQATETKQGQKKKKRKKRNVCYRGTYEERANGLLKWRKERIQCR
jgi:hypothetical protein